MTEAVPKPAYVGIGSNLDDPVRQVEAAIEHLAAIRGTRLLARSPLYRSAPWGGIEQPDFVNAVAALETRLDPMSLLQALRGIEDAQGRTRGAQRWGPRVIDLDLLVYADVTIDEPDLTVPHPRIAERNFVLLPLMDVAPELVIPGLGRVDAIPVDEGEPRIARIA